MGNIHQAADRFVLIRKRDAEMSRILEAYGSISEFLRQNGAQRPNGGYAYLVHSWDTKEGIAEIIEWK